jgi:hypothetical protein
MTETIQKARELAPFHCRLSIVKSRLLVFRKSITESETLFALPIQQLAAAHDRNAI